MSWEKGRTWITWGKFAITEDNIYLWWLTQEFMMQIFAGFMLKSTLPMTKKFFLSIWAIAKLVSRVNQAVCLRYLISLFDCAVDHSQDLMLLTTIQWMLEIFCGLLRCQVILQKNGWHQVSILTLFVYIVTHYILYLLFIWVN